MALDLEMQGGRYLWGLAFFVQLACGGSPSRDFGRETAGASSGGANASAGSAAGGKSGANASAGAGNASGSNGASGAQATGSCEAQTEDCFNGVDDDCDDQIDCDDSDCTPTTMCVPEATYGTAIDDQKDRPAEFTGGSSTMHGKLDGGNGCSGCDCISADPECGPYTVTLSNSQDNCATPGTVVANLTLYQFKTSCSGQSVPAPWNYISFKGTPTFNCTNTGTPTLSAPKWTDSSKFCAASATGSGCGAGELCVPKATGSACLLASGSQECPAPFPKKRSLYTTYMDTRACFCDCKTHGGDCSQISLHASGASDCSAMIDVRNDASFCAGQGAAYSAISYSFSGAWSPATTCEASDIMKGTLTPTDPQTLCCQ